MRDNSRFTAGLKTLGICLEEGQLRQFEQYYDILMEWNRVMNLTAITDYEEVITKHFLDSLSFVRIAGQLSGIEENSFDRFSFAGKRIIDVGTGAGFPGIPLKIAFPELDILLVDSLNKRIHFLNEVIGCLKLERIVAIHGRAEDLGHRPEYREQYDYCVSRAVAKLYLLSEYCLPFVKKNGSFLPYKSGKIADEIEEARFAFEKLGGNYQGAVTFFLPDSEMERSLIRIKKVKQTSAEYPRNAGKIAKRPLIRKENKKKG